MPEKTTKHIKLPLESQSRPSREGEYIQLQGTKFGIRSGAKKSDNTRAQRRAGATR
jgi:hypothetical protein